MQICSPGLPSLGSSGTRRILLRAFTIQNRPLSTFVNPTLWIAFQITYDISSEESSMDFTESRAFQADFGYLLMET